MMQDSHKSYINARKRLKVLLRGETDDYEVRSEIASITKAFPELADAFVEVKDVLAKESVTEPDHAAKAHAALVKATQAAQFFNGISLESQMHSLIYIFIFFMTLALDLFSNGEFIQTSSSIQSVFISSGCSSIKGSAHTRYLAEFIASYFSLAFIISSALLYTICIIIIRDKNKPLSTRVAQRLISFCIGDLLRVMGVRFLASAAGKILLSIL